MEDSNAFEVNSNEAYEQLFAYIRGKVALSEQDEAPLRQRFQLRKLTKNSSSFKKEKKPSNMRMW